jgi:hypothetical protein
MRRQSIGLAFTLILLVSVARVPAAAETAKLDRTIAKQPVFTSAPKYCLAVFGTSPQVKVWLILDNDTLYIDRNGNGDLSDAAKRVKMEKAQASGHVFKAGSVFASPDGKKQAQLTVECYGDLMLLTAELEPQFREIAGTDPTGNLRFASTPQDAPVVYFGGPMTLDTNRDPLHRGRATHLYAMVGTPGIGPGTFAALLHGQVNADAHIVAEIEVPRKGKASPQKQRVVLDRRCCGCLFHGAVPIPGDAGDVAKVSLSFENWEGSKVAPAQVEVKVNSAEENSASEDAILGTKK